MTSCTAGVGGGQGRLSCDTRSASAALSDRHSFTADSGARSCVSSVEGRRVMQEAEAQEEEDDDDEFDHEDDDYYQGEHFDDDEEYEDADDGEGEAYF